MPIFTEPFVSWEHPRMFIETNEAGKLAVNSETAALLQKIAQPVVVVAIAGAYRTGKSYLMNRLAGKPGFALGSELLSKTKGIWIWCTKHPHQAGKVLLLLDTEGLGDVMKEDADTHDTMIACLTLLLSSTFVFNLMGKIDNEMIKQLHFVSEITRNIQLKCRDAEQEEIEYADYMEYFPMFVLAVRDFVLELKIDGKEVTSDEYFDYVLQPKKGDSMKILQYNQPRYAIRDAFKSHHCFVFTRPVHDETLFPFLEVLQEHELTPVFLQQSEEFCSFIHANSTVKQIRLSEEATGRVLLEMTQQYVLSINSGNVPCIESTLEYVIRNENERLQDECLAMYRKNMDLLSFPVNEQTLHTVHVQASEMVLKHCCIHAILDNEKVYYTTLQKKLSEEHSAYVQRNEKSSSEKCNSIFQKLFDQRIEGPLKKGTFMVAGGYQMYESAMKQLVKEYSQQAKNEVKAEEVKQNFLKLCDSHRNLILASDQKITEKEKEMENHRKHTEMIESELNLQKTELQRQQERTELLRKDHEASITKIKADYDVRDQKRQEETKALIDKLLKQQAEALEQGFTRKASELQKQIENLQKQPKRSSWCPIM